MKRRYLLILCCAAVLVFLASEARGQASATYTVEPHLSLGEIAVKLYGKYKMWSKIAEWNGLAAPYTIKPGQKLVLNKKRRYDDKRGDRALVKMWLRRFAIKEGDIQVGPHAKSPVEIAKEKKLREDFQSAMKEIQKEEEKEDSPEVRAKKLLAEGETAFKEKRYGDALSQFRKSKNLDNKPMVTWFYEIRTLRLMKNDDEAKTIAKSFVNNHPELKDIPLFQSLLKSENR